MISGFIVQFGRLRQLKYEIWRWAMEIQEKRLDEYGDDLNALIADVELGGRVGKVVFIIRPNPVEAGDGLVVMKRRQLLKLLMPDGLPPEFAEASTDRGGH